MSIVWKIILFVALAGSLILAATCAGVERPAALDEFVRYD
jgi:hypothetical protein